MTPDQWDRFAPKFTRAGDDDCWLWFAGSIKHGYGVFNIAGRARLAHRLAYEHFIGPIPDGMFVCHRCDTPACVNPAHFFIGKHAENNQDKARKGRCNPAIGDRNGSRKHPERLPHGDAHYMRIDSPIRTQRLAQLQAGRAGMVGEGVYNHVLNETAVRRIREMKESGYGYAGIAKELSLGASAVAHVYYGRSWKHVK